MYLGFSSLIEIAEVNVVKIYTDERCGPADSIQPISSWWRHQMETLSALLAICAGNSPVSGEFPRTKASDAELFYVFFDLCQNKRLSKQL